MCYVGKIEMCCKWLFLLKARLYTFLANSLAQWDEANGANAIAFTERHSDGFYSLFLKDVNIYPNTEKKKTVYSLNNL